MQTKNKNETSFIHHDQIFIRDMLLHMLPLHHHSVHRLADKLKLSRQTLYRALKYKRISAKSLHRIMYCYYYHKT